MNRSSFTVFLLAAASSFTGCSSYSVREGIWVLSFPQMHYTQTGEEASVSPKVVKVEPGTSEDGTEIVEIAPLERDEDLPPMYGDISPGRIDDRPVITITPQSDKNWRWQMIGRIRDPYTIDGTKVHALGRFGRAQDLSLEGRWMMKWLRDLEE